MVQVLAHSLDDAAASSGLSKSDLRRAINSGQLRAVKRGRRTLVLDLHRFLEALPAVQPKAAERAPKADARGTGVGDEATKEGVS